jgi:hypothetical protein
MKAASNRNRRSRRAGRRRRKPVYQQYARVLAIHKRILQEQYKVKEIGIFGSFVRGEQKRRSDLDVLVEFSETPGLFEFIDLEDYLRKVLDKKVDLVDKQGIRRQLRDEILGEVVYV